MQKDSLSRQGIGMIIGLTLQYLLGTFTTLFVPFPDKQPPRILWEFAWTQLPVALHIILGILLLIGAITLLIRSIIQKRKIWIIASAVAVASILAALITGASFISSQKDIYSFIMALSFIIATLAYFTGLYQSKTK